MEELEKNQKVGETVTPAGQTTTTSSSRRIRATTSTSISGAKRAVSTEEVDNGITKVTTQCE